MTTTAGIMLVNRIMPLIAAAIARGAIRFVGAEDREEIEQDTLAQAAAILDSAERAGKNVTPGNVAYYSILVAKTGRRSTCGGRTDVMSSATQLDGRSEVISLDEVASVDGEQDEEVTLLDTLAVSGDDPATHALRNHDWNAMEGVLDDRSRLVLRETAAGYGGKDLAARLKVSQPRASQVKREVGQRVRKALGDDVLATVLSPTRWQRHVHTYQERRACRRLRCAA